MITSEVYQFSTQSMKSNREHLSVRQIVNRYKKGVYTDDCADNICAAISSSEQEFNNVAVPIQTCWVDEVLENIELCIRLLENEEEKEAILSTVSDERARSVLADLATPEVWKVIQGDGEICVVFHKQGLLYKYPLRNRYSVLQSACDAERNKIKELGIDYSNLFITLMFLFKDIKD